MEKKIKKPFRGRDAVAVTAIWFVVYLLVTYLLNKTITSENIVIMFFGLIVVFVISIILKNGW